MVFIGWRVGRSANPIPTMGSSYPQRQLCPMHHRFAVEKRHDAGLDRRRSIVRQYDRRDDHVAAVVEHDRYRRLARPIASGERVSATATLHPGNRDRPAGAERRNLAADEIEVAHAIEVGVIGDAGRAIAGAELGAKIELDLAAAVGRLAGGRASTASPVTSRAGPGARSATAIAPASPTANASANPADFITRTASRRLAAQRALCAATARACAISGLTGSAFSVSAAAAA